jgi:hypothetical protein
MHHQPIVNQVIELITHPKVVHTLYAMKVMMQLKLLMMPLLKLH